MNRNAPDGGLHESKASSAPPDAAGDDPAGSVTCLVGALARGDRLAAQALWQRFFPRLCGLARKTLAGHPQRIADADDAAQSAFVSFWQQASRGELERSLDRNGLWNLLGLMTVRKALRQVTRERARKRGGGQVVSESALAQGAEHAGEPNYLENLVGRMPPAEFDLHCEELMLMLDERLRVYAMLRVMGYTNREIAAQLDCTERKVERKLHLIRLRWEDELAD